MKTSILFIIVLAINLICQDTVNWRDWLSGVAFGVVLAYFCMRLAFTKGE